MAGNTISQRRIVSLISRPVGHYHDIHLREDRTMMTEAFANQAFDPVSAACQGDSFLGNSKPQTRGGLRTGSVQDSKKAVRRFPGLSENTVEIPGIKQPVTSQESKVGGIRNRDALNVRPEPGNRQSIRIWSEFSATNERAV